MPRLANPGGIDQADLQGNVLCGYGNSFDRGVFGFIHVDEASGGRGLLAELAGRVTDAVPWSDEPPIDTLNVGVSYAGLEALEVPGVILASFPEEFRLGMTSRAELLGDTGPSAPQAWQPGLRPGEPHLLVTILAREAGALERRRRELVQLLDRAGCRMVHEQESRLIERPGGDGLAREHFGFADGLCQPSIADSAAGPRDFPGRGTPLKRDRWQDLAAGEFVLGYEDEEGTMSAGPAEPLGRNGSFMVVRKLYQDVALFNGYLREKGNGDQELLAAKIVGRWRSGAPLELSPDRDDPALTQGGARHAEMNDFRYQGDPTGLRCPLGAHVRRANPRDALGWQGRLSKRHRIIRRGMPYGEPPADPNVPDDDDRGLMFICFQASIERQFELIQSRWLNDGDPFGLGSEKDLLIANEDPHGKMTIQGKPPRFLSPLPSFVTTRGGEYFFAPGLAGLRALGSGIAG